MGIDLKQERIDMWDVRVRMLERQLEHAKQRRAEAEKEQEIMRNTPKTSSNSINSWFKALRDLE